MRVFIYFVLLAVVFSCTKEETAPKDDSTLKALQAELNLAVDLIGRSAYDSARASLIISDSLAKELNNEYAVSSVLSNYGWMWLRQLQYDSASYYYQKSLEIDEAILDSSTWIKHLNDLGKVYVAQGFYGEAVNNYEVALGLATVRSDSLNIALVSNSLGNVLVELEDHKKAASYYQTAMDFWLGKNRYANYAIALHNMANTWVNQDSLQKAIPLFMQSLLIKDSLNRTSSKAYTLTSIGATYLKMDSLNMALKFLNEAMEIRQSLSDKLGVSETGMKLAELYTKKGEFLKAEKLLDRAEATAKELNKPDLRRDALFYKKQLFRKSKRLLDLAIADEEYDILTDSIYREQRLKVQEVQAESVLQNERQKTALAEQATVLALIQNQAEKQRSQFRLILIVVILIGLCVIAWQLRLIKKRNNNLQALNARIKMITDSAFHSQTNAISLLASLMRSRFRASKNDAEKDIFNEVNTRIEALAVLTKKIFQTRIGDRSGERDKVELSSYLTELISDTINAMPPSQAVVELDLVALEVEPKIALNLGLVINEIIANFSKYAIVGGGTKLTFQSSRKGEFLEIRYIDNGPGFKHGTPAEFSASFGSKMMRILVEEDLGGQLELRSDDDGTKYKIIIKI